MIGWENAASDPSSEDGDLAAENEALRAKVGELADLIPRLERQAQDSTGLAEDLYLAHKAAAEAERRASDAASTFMAILDAMSEGVAMVDCRGCIEKLNAAAEAMLPGDAATAHDQHISEFIQVEAGYDFSPETLYHEELTDAEGRLLTPSGQGIHIEVSTRKVAGASSDTYIVVFKDVEERKKAQAKILELALYDALTNLANRNLFQRRLDDAIALAKRTGKMIALLYLDLDHFKTINDTYGHPVGDGLLRQVADKLRSTARDIDTVARLGGDEFAIVMPEQTDLYGACKLAARIIDALTEPMVVDGTLVRTGTSIGISFFPEDAEDPNELIRLADIALYEAKKAGRSSFKIHDEQSNTVATMRSSLETDLKLAIVRHEIEVHYQPIVSAKDGLPIAAEALARWRHPSKGLLGPDEFIAAAEELGLIGAIGRQVMTRACHDCRRWIENGWSDFRVAVNVSPTQVKEKSLIEDVTNALRYSGLEARHLELEIIESLYMDDYTNAVGMLTALRAMGVQLAIDDFGTGHSSLARLQRLPVQRLKIDRSFVQAPPSDTDGSAICQMIIALGRSLQLRVVAEGIETEGQMRMYQGYDCDEFQGFYFCKPCPADQFTAWLEDHRAPHDSWRDHRKTSAG